MPDRFLAQVAVMAVVTYLIRAVPLALCRGSSGAAGSGTSSFTFPTRCWGP